MPFPKSAQSKGGKAPASESQKQAARTWMQQQTPFTKSTGSRSSLGKLVSKYNRVHGIYRKTVKSWQEDDFEQACREAEQAISAFEQDRQNYPGHYQTLAVKRFQSQDDEGHCCAVFVVQAIFEGWQAEFDAWMERIQRLRAVHGAEGRMRYTASIFVPDNDPWLRALLVKLAQSQ